MPVAPDPAAQAQAPAPADEPAQPEVPVPPPVDGADPMPNADENVDVVQIDYKSATTLTLSLFNGDGVSLGRLRPELNVAKRNKSGMLTLVVVRGANYKATREERVAEKQTKPADWKGEHAVHVVNCLRDSIATRGKVLQRAFLAFENHAWVDEDTNEFAVHIHLAWQANDQFAWYAA